MNEHKHMVPVDIATNTELFKGFGMKECKNVLIVFMLALVIYWMLGIPKIVRYEEVQVTQDNIEFTYDENGENKDIEAELNQQIEQKEESERNEAKTERIPVKENMIPNTVRLIAIIVPVSFMILLQLPLLGRESLLAYIKQVIKFKRSKKIYMYERIG